jgi:hypothetical protein
MSVTFVTAFFEQREMFYSVDRYIGLFEQLASTGVQILLFFDEKLRDRGEDLCRKFPNVMIPEYMTLDLSYLPENVVLPASRSVKKDTAEFITIQCEKLHLLTKARQYTDRPFLAWIDFGIFYVFKHKEACIQKLREIETSTFQTEKIYSGSCWPRGTYDIWDRICWRFCGNFLLGHRDLFEAAAQEQSRIIREHLPRLTWEVNYWTLMDDYFLTYPGDHTDVILINLPCQYP